MLIDQTRRSKAEDDYLDVLSDLVEAYEDVHVPIGPVPDADMLRSCLDDSARYTSRGRPRRPASPNRPSPRCSPASGSSIVQIGKLARYFKVSPGAFAFGE